jgi:hypothetical protein
MSGLQYTSLCHAVLHNRPEILIDAQVNSGFIPVPRLACPSLGYFAGDFA